MARSLAVTVGVGSGMGIVLIGAHDLLNLLVDDRPKSVPGRHPWPRTVVMGPRFQRVLLTNPIAI